MKMVMEFLQSDQAALVIRAAIIFVLGLILAKPMSSAVARLCLKHVTPQQDMLIKRFSYYAIVLMAIISGLNELGFQLSVLLGAAGVLTVAVGFAAQTSVSNLISGLFLIVERPFGVGDVITVGSTTGEVLSIDLLSVKLRKFDNLFVRIPNETLVKSEITNITQFPIRRIDLILGVAYKEDLERVQDILFKIADRNPLCLEEPVPLYILQGFGDSAVNMQFSVWVARANFLAVRNTIQTEIKKVFDAEGIEIPFPHRTLYAGSVTEPFPVCVVDPASLTSPAVPRTKKSESD